MRYETAPMSPVIKVITTIIVALTAVLLAISILRPPVFIPAMLLGLVTLGCYLRAPVAYYVSGAGLTVRFHWGRKTFGKIVKVSRIEGSVGFTLRLWGNGGLFAGTGIFWNRTWGIFRAYVTTSNRSNLLLLETETGNVLISPANPGDFLDRLELQQSG
ncbi:MAG: hypothetical protein HY912_14095 [Desulfomonile tiedjei]|uniref:Bacterial Pleckstrin homology domain-containing protein n=1 Tax=Desulfomonile tiedjei TaxID=2358 RepID=A0A9D6Z4K0_9BACT|nr:hypothetical protein [Desulfomonile tiedjei]